MLLCFSCLVALLFAEVSLRILGWYASHTEKIGLGRYQSIYEANSTLDIRYPANTVITIAQNEFSHVIHSNALGFNDKEWSKNKTSLCRVVALGDSFTEGVGSSNDSSWTKLVQKMLPAKEIFSAGISGSDPVFAYDMLQRLILPYQPDVVIVTINSSDIGDIRVRGGLERFQSDSLSVKRGPSWEKWYARSFLVRLIVHKVLRYDRYLVSQEQAAIDTKQALNTLIGMTDMFYKLSQEHNFRLVF